MKTVHVDCTKIQDWPTFYDVFSSTFGFPRVFGRNLDAWVDCMARLDEDLNEVRVQPGEVVELALDAAEDFRARCPQQFRSLVECAVFVNLRRRDLGKADILFVSRHP